MVLLALLVSAPVALAVEGETTREEYVQRVDSICKRSKATNERILHGVKKLVVKRKAYAVAGKRVLRAARSFSGAVGKIARVPRPVADQPTLKKWLGYLKLERLLLFKIGKALKHSQTKLVSRLESRASHVNRQANTLVFRFEFHYCNKEAHIS